MRSFWRDSRGNVAILFAFAAIPVVGAMGAALDYSMANSYRTAMQKAADSTALALAKIMPVDDAKLNEVAQQYFIANIGAYNMGVPDVVAEGGQGIVKVNATLNYSPIMAKVFGATNFELGAAATARWGIGKVEVALVLDNSGSMGQHGRMGHLKSAAHDLLKVLKGAAQHPDDAKVAIVPFDSAVRLPYNQNNAPNWIKWGHNGSCNVTSRRYDTNTQLGCVDAGGVWTWKVWQTNKWSSWAGCVEDRDKDPNLNHDVLDTAPDSSNHNSLSARRTRYPARPCDDNSLNTIMPLNTNWGTETSNDAATLHGKINRMQPAGFTNIAIGLAWGWHLLSPTEIYTQGAAYNTPELTKYVVLMTDGDNTRSRYDSCSGWGTCEIDARTEAVCENIKNAGIQVFTVRLVQGNAGLLQKCASKPSMYYDVQDANMLSGVFKDIASQIASLHLSK